jgi:hypothetical protein
VLYCYDEHVRSALQDQHDQNFRNLGQYLRPYEGYYVVNPWAILPLARDDSSLVAVQPQLLFLVHSALLLPTIHIT